MRKLKGKILAESGDVKVVMRSNGEAVDIVAGKYSIATIRRAGDKLIIETEQALAEVQGYGGSVVMEFDVPRVVEFFRRLKQKA